MADWPGIYNTGTATVAANGTVVTFQNAGNLAQAVRVGDRFGSHRGLPIRISEIGPATGLTASQVRLAFAWPGPAQTAATYEIMLTPYDSGWRQAMETLIERYGSGAVAALSELTLANNQLPYANGPGSMAMTPFTAYGRQIVGRANATQVRSDLETVRYRALVGGGTTLPPVEGIGAINLAAYSANTPAAPTTGAGGIVSFDMPWSAGGSSSGIGRSLSIASLFGNAGLWWTGYTTTGETDWKRVLSFADVLGSVSQSANAGTVIEFGVNSNGWYCRLKGGLQICGHVFDETSVAWDLPIGSGALFSRPTSLSWTFPAAFVGTPYIGGSTIRPAGVAQGVFFIGRTVTTATIRAWASSVVSAGSEKSIVVLAQGRWHA